MPRPTHPRTTTRRSPRSAPRSAAPPAPPGTRPQLVPFAAVFGVLTAAEGGWLAHLLDVAWYLVVPAALGAVALAGAALVWLGRARGWLVLTVAAALMFLGLAVVAVLFGLIGGGEALAVALLLLIGPLGALLLAPRRQVRQWSSPRRAARPARVTRRGGRAG